MKFYEMELTDFNLGWEDQLKEAKEKCPKGRFFIVEGQKVWYAPINTYNSMIKDYDDIAARMRQIISKGIKISDLSELLKLDILLYDLVFDWTEDAEYDLFGYYEKKKIENIESDEYELYFDKDFNSDIQKYKLF